MDSVFLCSTGVGDACTHISYMPRNLAHGTSNHSSKAATSRAANLETPLLALRRQQYRIRAEIKIFVD